MAVGRLTWGAAADRKYETGLKQGVLYPVNAAGAYTPGVAWNGLTGVTESPEGAEATDLYADDGKYLTMRSAENLKGTIECYTYPDEFAVLNGEMSLINNQDGVFAGQQSRGIFGLCYRTVIGNAVSGDNYGYKLHCVYGCQVSPSEKAYSPINDSPEAVTFSFEFSTTPVPIGTTGKQTASITIDSTKFSGTAPKAKLAALEDKLYGTNASGGQEGTEAYLPLPAEIITTLTPDA